QDARGAVDHPRLVAHAQQLLARGVDGVVPFGTTGEGPSFGVGERIAGLDALLAAGVPPTRIVAATGCAALPDTTALTRHAIAAGCAGALVMPPFFFKGLTDDGVYAGYARMIDAVADPRLRLYLYHIPQVTAVPIAASVIARLLADYPGVVAGLKDSEGDLAHSTGVLARFPGLHVLVGHEPHLPAMLAAGGAGTVCGIANLYPGLIRRLHDHAATGADTAREQAAVKAFLAAALPYPMLPAFKALAAALTGDATWETVRPPLAPLSAGDAAAFVAAITASPLGAEPSFCARDDAVSGRAGPV
ncbi:MAG: dihydrodipicolinate synthase family protein, partial [Betaproteobacteria bacterium]